MKRALHLGDIHPDDGATFAGKTVLDPETGLNQALTDLAKSLDDVLAVATDAETRCDVALVTGDVFNSPRPHANEVRVIQDFLFRLAKEMPVLVIAGNHDISQNANDATALECLRGHPGISVYTAPRAIVLNLDGQPVRFCMLPYPTKSRILATLQHQDKSPEEVTALINHGLAAILRNFTAQFEEGIPNILLAHGSVGNATVGDQPRSLAHDILIPIQFCAEFDYVALGHIHQPQQVAKNAWYSGSLMRATFGEEHEPKGFNLVEIAPGEPVRVEYLSNPWARKYKTLTMKNVREFEWQSVSAEHVYRIKDQLTADEYEAAKPMVQKWVDEHPWTQVNLEIVVADRMRDAGMGQLLTVDEALTRTLAGKVDEAELPIILEKHHDLMAQQGR